VKRMGTRSVGRPRQRWQEDVMEDLKKVENKKNWKETAKDRRTWRDLAEKTKTHRGLKCQMMIMVIPLLSLKAFVAYETVKPAYLTLWRRNFLLNFSTPCI